VVSTMQGSLRDALDCGLLAKPGGFLAPSAVLTLAHDIAAAMLHLHSEGIVHGDLKAGNVMLTSCGASSSEGLSGARIWAATGGRPLTAKGELSTKGMCVSSIAAYFGS